MLDGQTKANVVWDLAPHDISILRFLLDADPISVNTHGSSCVQEGIEDVAYTTLMFPNNIMAHIRSSWLDPSKQRPVMMGVPTNYLLMAQHPEFLHTDLTSLRIAVTGGGPAPVQLLRLWHDRGVALTQGYGLSEAGPNVTCLPVAEAASHAGSVGYPYPFVEVALLTERKFDNWVKAGKAAVAGEHLFDKHA